MRRLAQSFAPAFAMVIALAGCSQQPQKSGEQVTTMDVREEAARAARGDMAGGAPAMGPPAIAPQAAPGVAFNYRYAFVLPSPSISAVQEQHAAACEKLGIAQCRITGMRYTLLDEDQVRAELSFKLAPELARAFGKQGIAAIEAAKGKLVDAAIEGQDVGTQISASQRRSADTRGELARIEARLAAGGLGDAERTELTQQAERLRAQLNAERDTRSAGEEMLANTPMTYSYTGDESFTLGGNPVGDAAEGAWNSLTTMIAFVLMALGVTLPWLVLLVLGLLVWRSHAGLWLRAKLRGRPKAQDPVPPAG